MHRVPLVSSGIAYRGGDGTIYAVLDDGDEYSGADIIGWRPLPAPPADEPKEGA